MTKVLELIGSWEVLVVVVTVVRLTMLLDVVGGWVVMEIVF